MVRRGGIVVATFVMALAGARVACAQSVPPAAALTPEPYRLGWTRGQGADECPNESALAERVARSLGRNPFAEAAPRSIEGYVTRGESAWHAELRVRDDRGVVLGRRELDVPGDDCSPLATAAALAIVLTIDPNAPLSAADAAVTSLPTNPPPIPPETTVAPPAPAERAPTPRCPACRARERGASVSGLAVGAFGPLPRAALGAELDGQLPVSKVSLLVALRFLPGVNSEDGHVEAGLATGALGVCGRWAAGTGELALCGQGEVGAVTVVARDYLPVHPGSYPWVAFGGGPRVTWPRESGVSLELGAGLLVPVLRPRFEVETALKPQFQSAAVAFLLTLGVRLGGLGE